MNNTSCFVFSCRGYARTVIYMRGVAKITWALSKSNYIVSIFPAVFNLMRVLFHSIYTLKAEQNNRYKTDLWEAPNLLRAQRTACAPITASKPLSIQSHPSQRQNSRVLLENKRSNETNRGCFTPNLPTRSIFQRFNATASANELCARSATEDRINKQRLCCHSNELNRGAQCEISTNAKLSTAKKLGDDRAAPENALETVLTSTFRVSRK